MLQPKKYIFKKKFKQIKIKKKHETLLFGEFALKSLNNAEITAKQIQTLKSVINKKLKKMGTLWIRIFPQNPITKKPAEVRMGKGKGAVDHWSAFVAQGTILLEISGISEDIAKKALIAGAKKLYIQTVIIKKGL